MISAAVHDERVEVTCDDAGPGLPPGESSRLFDKFQRGNDARAATLLRSETTNRPLYVVVQIIDIDRQKQAEAALAKSESLWNFALVSGSWYLVFVSCLEFAIWSFRL